MKIQHALVADTKSHAEMYMGQQTDGPVLNMWDFFTPQMQVKRRKVKGYFSCLPEYTGEKFVVSLITQVAY
jgi:hypothetical protein